MLCPLSSCQAPSVVDLAFECCCCCEQARGVDAHRVPQALAPSIRTLPLPTLYPSLCPVWKGARVPVTL